MRAIPFAGSPMRFARPLARVTGTTVTRRTRTHSYSRSSARAVTAITLLALAACGGDSLTEPRVAPSPPNLTLTGGVGTPIFPTVTLGEFQPIGVAIGLNNAGQVVGSGWLSPSDDDPRAFRWSVSTGAQSVSGVCCGTMWGRDINSAGVMVGTTQISANTGNRGFIATGTTATLLPILAGGDPEGSADAVAINDAGQTVGRSPASGFTQHAVLWSAAGVVQDLGTLGGTNSQAIDLNASGQVIGSSQIAGDATTHFFLWSSGTGMTDLNTTVNAGITSVVEINDAGQIVGTYTAAGGQSHAFLYTPGSGLRDLGTLGGATSAPTGLNGRGDVVGNSDFSNASTHAFLWTAAEGMEDITALSGVPEVRRLNDNLQTLTGTGSPTSPGVPRVSPRLVQLQVTQSNAPPTALFNVECNGLTCVLDGSVSLDDKPGLTFSWNLGKFPGGSATGAKVTVTYPHAGQRTVTLTVTDAQGLQSTIAKTLTITDFPIAAFTTSCTGLTCTFDSSPSSNNGAPIAERNWAFGDGQTAYNTLAPSHTFAQAGTYNVTLEILGNNFSTERAVITQQVTVSAPVQNQPPTASFTHACTGQSFPHQCAFNASGSTDDNGIVSYAWNWGNGRSETKTLPTTRNTWAAPGTYTVTLTTKDAGGLTASTSQQVVVP